GWVGGGFDRMIAVLSSVAASVATDPAVARGLGAGPDASRELFDLVERHARDASAGADEVAATIYDAGVARAWVGRPSDIRLDLPGGPAPFFVTPSSLGLRLVHVVPLSGPNNRRPNAVAVEYVLSPAPAAATITA